MGGNSFINPEMFMKTKGVDIKGFEGEMTWQQRKGRSPKEPRSTEFIKFVEALPPGVYFSRYYTDPQFRQNVHRAFRKQDDPMLSSTPDLYMSLYGRAFFAQTHHEVSAWAAMSKVPWLHDGIRMLLSDPALQGEWATETGTFPNVVKPDFASYLTDSKWLITRWEITEKLLQHAARNEGINLESDLRAYFASMHLNTLDSDILADASAQAALSGADRYGTAPVAIESIDRVISCDSEEDLWGHDDNDWFDPFEDTIDRDGGTDYDSVVLHKAAEEDDDRPLTDALLKEMIRRCEDAGARSIKEGGGGWLLTGRDTRDKLVSLWQSQMRYTPDISAAGRLGQMRVQLNVNGVRTAIAHDAGFKISSYMDYPIIVDKHVPKDGASRIYLIDNNFLKIKFMIPPMHLYAGGPQDWLKLDAFKSIYAYLTVAELDCTRFSALGKIRDLV